MSKISPIVLCSLASDAVVLTIAGQHVPCFVVFMNFCALVSDDFVLTMHHVLHL